MHEDQPTYLRTVTWAELLFMLNADEALRLRLGVKQCPFSGRVEEYTLVDRLGGELNVWPAKWRRLIEAGHAEFASAA